MAALQCNEQLALKACFLGYTRRTSSLPFRLGESPRTTGRECRVRTRVDYPRESQLARQEAIPFGASRAACGGTSSVSSPSDAGSAPRRTNQTGLILSAAASFLCLVLYPFTC